MRHGDELHVLVKSLPEDLHNALLKYLEAAENAKYYEARLARVRIVNETNNWSDSAREEYIKYGK